MTEASNKLARELAAKYRASAAEMRRSASRIGGINLRSEVFRGGTRPRSRKRERRSERPQVRVDETQLKARQTDGLSKFLDRIAKEEIALARERAEIAAKNAVTIEHEPGDRTQLRPHG